MFIQRVFFIFSGALILFSISLSAQDDSIKRPDVSVDWANEYLFETSVAPLFPQEYEVDLGYRFWLRVVNYGKDRTRDNTFSLSCGYLNIKDEQLVNFKAGDLIGIRQKVPMTYENWKFGILGEFIAGRYTQAFVAHEQIGFQYGKIYLHAGMNEPVFAWKEKYRLKTAFEFGIDYFLRENIVYVN